MKKYISSMIFLSLLEIGLALYLTFWREAFWQAVADRQLTSFTEQLIIFTIIALSLCVITAVASYCGNLAAIKWRENLNNQALAVCDSRIENMSQRIQEDCREYPQLVIDLGFGLGKAVVYVLAFAVTLCYEFSYTYLLIISAYAVVSTLIAKKIAKPLINLNYESQRAEATYRSNLTISNYNDCTRIMLGIAKKTKRLNYFQTLYGQMGVIIPICIVAPSYFSAAITIGMLMQVNSIMMTILENMSFGISSFGSINRLISCKRRLNEAGVR